MLYDGPDLRLFILVGWGRGFLSVAWPTGVQLVFFVGSGFSAVVLFGAQGSPSTGSLLGRGYAYKTSLSPPVILCY